MQINMQTIVMFTTFVVTVGTLIWRMADLHHDNKANKESLKRAHDRIDKLEDTQANKIEELSSEIRAITETQIRMEEKLNLILQIEKKEKPKTTRGKKK
jgi:hypothetical protein